MITGITGLPDFCVGLFCKFIRSFFLRNYTIEFSDNRKIWETASLVFSEKAFQKESIILNNSNKAINNNEKLGELSNKDFSKRVENLDIDKVMANTI